MIASLEILLRRLRRALSRSEWLRRLLRLPVSAVEPGSPGLVMIQIDGLSHSQFNRALEKGELPFVQRLITREHHEVHSQYSGLPAATPAVQAELFYGVKAAVPAFSFKDHKLGRVVRMFEPEAAAAVEAELQERGNDPLLEGGSVYADNFTGGAEESHFCPAALGWGPTLCRANPIVLLILLAANLYSFLRAGVLLLVEFVLAIIDFFRGLIQGQNLLKELKFIPTRVAICILMRELCVIGGKIDIARGLPVIHINFLGYDEQAHRRGPDSLFAHWTLKGIDDAIARLWRAAHRSLWRHYEVWIYSDHGQMAARSYQAEHGRHIKEAVAAAFDTVMATGLPGTGPVTETVQTHRVRFLGGNRFQRLFSVSAHDTEHEPDAHPVVTALGPVGFVYSRGQLDAGAREQIARELVVTHGVPAVLCNDGGRGVRAWSGTGEFHLPEDAPQLFGADHPFLDEIGRDLVELCRHPDAGDLVLLGWVHGVTPLTFAIENGSHAGASPEETHAFSVLPWDAPLPERSHEYLRPGDLREAALQYLGRLDSIQTRPRRRAVPEKQVRQLRVMTYNVHSCLGMDGRLAVERIARVIARANPDVVALQELDVGRIRTGEMDQAQLIAHYLEMDYHFHAAMHVEEEQYGDAILTHLPVRLVKAAPLPGAGADSRRESRGALWVAVDLYGTDIQIINTHLGLNSGERLAQAQALLGEEWLGNEQCRGPVILCGDFNAMPASRVCRLLQRRLDDAQIQLQRHRPKGTFFGRFPSARIDHIYVNPGLEVTAIEVPRSQQALVASDHLPLIAELHIPAESGERPGKTTMQNL